MILVLAKIKNPIGKLIILALLTWVLLAIGADAKSIEESLPAKAKTLVNNLSLSYPQFLNNQETLSLEHKLAGFAKDTSTQISILIIDDLLNLDPNDYATRLFNKWGIGTKETNQGVLILIKPTSDNGGRVIYISTGYGSEAVLPDASAKSIIEKIIKPNFKTKNYYQGLDQATSAIIEAFKTGGSKEIKAEEKVNPKAGLIFIFLSIAFWILLAEKFFKRLDSRTLGSKHHRRHSNDFDPPIFLGLGGGGFSGGSGGGFGGGFGGFGGGMSGGGGAGGDW